MARKTSKYGRKGTAVSPLSVILNIIGTLMLIAVLIVGAISAVPKLTGHEVYNVVTGSMEPEIPVGSMIIVSDVDPSELQTDDVITYLRSDNGETVTHRVVSNDTANSEIITKGDANDQNDMAPVPYMNVVGKVTKHVPYLGSVLAVFSTTLGKLSAVCFALAGLLFTLISAKIR